MQRYFVEKSSVILPNIYITGDDCHHIKNVMRMNIGDKVYVSDQDNSWIAIIESIDLNQVVLKVEKELDEQKELPLNITIAHGLVSREKKEETIQKITQLGAVSYIPVLMKKSVVKLVKEKEQKQTERLQKIAKEASEQSHRTKLLNVELPITFNELLKLENNYDICLYASTVLNPKDQSFKKIIKEQKYNNILILVGPEAGIDESEISKLTNWTAITLGPRILRTEVAPLYIMSAISYELELGE
jgi:16S rRNA (uracil1498-N3)-methyltransferase